MNSDEDAVNEIAAAREGLRSWLQENGFAGAWVDGREAISDLENRLYLEGDPRHDELHVLTHRYANALQGRRSADTFRVVEDGKMKWAIARPPKASSEPDPASGVSATTIGGYFESVFEWEVQDEKLHGISLASATGRLCAAVIDVGAALANLCDASLLEDIGRVVERDITIKAHE